MSLTWMAWTWPTAAFFVFVFASIAAMGVLEWRSPGGAPRRGILGLDTTRGDRLFITLLGRPGATRHSQPLVNSFGV
jgi:predicted small integral membrane protein